MTASTYEQKKIEKQRDLYLATLIHDLKNPLQAQISTLNLLCNGGLGQVNEGQKEMLDMILETNIYLKNMVCSLLSTYKDYNGIITLKREKFSINKLLQKCINEISQLAFQKKLKISYFSAECDIFGDEVQIRRVLENLLNNTVNYAFEQTVVKIKLKQTKSKAIISFLNTSPIISESLKNSVFDKYVCDTSLTNHEGVGLGLYFCKKIIDAHGGRIYLTANGNRNIFTVEIPQFLTDKNFNNSIEL